MNATGLRDQRVRLYRREDSGSDGSVQSVFVFDGEWWGRVDERSSSTRTQDGRVSTVISSSAEFSDEVSVPAAGVLLDTTAPARAWWIRGINSNRLLRRVTVGLDRIPDEQFRRMQGLPMSGESDGTGNVGAVVAVQLVDPDPVTA